MFIYSKATLNTAIWLYKQEIIENHEYLTDSAVVKSGIDTESYSFQLIRSGDSIKQPFISGFSFIKIKNRLNMMYKQEGKLKVPILGY